MPLQPGTGILSHEYQEQKVLPRMVRVASLPQKKAPGDARQAAAARALARAGYSVGSGHDGSCPPDHDRGRRING